MVNPSPGHFFFFFTLGVDGEHNLFHIHGVMKNNQITIQFLAKLDRPTKNEILGNIAKHYNISQAEAHEEVTDEDAEHLLDYVTGSTRTATSALMKKHGFN